MITALLCAVSGMVGGAMQVNDTEALKRSVVSQGDPARILRVMARAQAGGKVVVGVIGGSITQGAAASKEEYRWGNRVAQWWREAFPKAEIQFVNAGIGATGSDIGAHRCAAHLLAKRPDFVVAEYAVNDGDTQLAAETLEGVVRQVLSAPNKPGMMLLFTMNNAGGNAQAWHSKVGAHYRLPMVSFRDALWPEIQAGRLRWEDVEGDAVHPNDRGHGECARFIGGVLQGIKATLKPGSAQAAIRPLPKPLISDVFQYATMLGPAALKPTRSEGWVPGPDHWAFGAGWKSTQPGATLEFTVEGSTVSVIYFRIKGAMGRALAQVDDLPPVTLEGWFDADWGGYDAAQIVARDLKPGPHRLTLRVLNERAPASAGYEFRLIQVLTAGMAHR